VTDSTLFQFIAWLRKKLKCRTGKVYDTSYCRYDQASNFNNLPACPANSKFPKYCRGKLYTWYGEIRTRNSFVWTALCQGVVSIYLP